MSRRNKPEKRIIPPDVRYNSVNVQSFINRILRSGKKSVAAACCTIAFDIVEERAKRDPVGSL